MLYKRIARLFKGKNTRNWVQNITQAYDETKHQSIGRNPLEAMCLSDVNEPFHWQYKRIGAATRTAFQMHLILETVKISLIFSGQPSCGIMTKAGLP